MPELDGVKYDYTPSGIKKYYKAKAEKKKKSQYSSAKDEYVDAKVQGRKNFQDYHDNTFNPQEQDKPSRYGRAQKIKAGQKIDEQRLPFPKGAGMPSGKSKKRYYGKKVHDPISKR